MSALRQPAPLVDPGAPPAAPAVARPQPRRQGSASRPVGAAGQQRRSLQRDLARREASLRISRRVSGPAGGVARSPLRTGPTAPQPPRAAAAPVLPFAPQRPSGAAQRPSAPAARLVPSPAQRPPTPVPFGVTAPAAPAPALPGAATAAGAARAQPAPALHRPRLIALPGGLIEAPAEPGRRGRLSTPAVIVSAIALLVVTVGLVVALQIRMTQVNEQIGEDLIAITRAQQAVTEGREAITRQISGAKVDGEASRLNLIEPDVQDIEYLRAGNRAATAARAARELRRAPVAPSGAEAEAAAAASKAAAADATEQAAVQAKAQVQAGTASALAASVDEAIAPPSASSPPETDPAAGQVVTP